MDIFNAEPITGYIDELPSDGNFKLHNSTIPPKIIGQLLQLLKQISQQYVVSTNQISDSNNTITQLRLESICSQITQIQLTLLEESSLCRTFIAILYYKLFWLKKALLELSFYLDDFLDQNQDYELQNLLKPIFSELKTVQNLTENLYTDYDSSHPSPETELQKYSSKRNTILDILQCLVQITQHFGEYKSQFLPYLQELINKFDFDKIGSITIAALLFDLIDNLPHSSKINNQANNLLMTELGLFAQQLPDLDQKLLFTLSLYDLLYGPSCNEIQVADKIKQIRNMNQQSKPQLDMNYFNLQRLKFFFENTSTQKLKTDLVFLLLLHSKEEFDNVFSAKYSGKSIQVEQVLSATEDNVLFSYYSTKCDKIASNLTKIFQKEIDQIKISRPYISSTNKQQQKEVYEDKYLQSRTKTLYIQDRTVSRQQAEIFPKKLLEPQFTAEANKIMIRCTSENNLTRYKLRAGQRLPLRLNMQFSIFEQFGFRVHSKVSGQFKESIIEQKVCLYQELLPPDLVENVSEDYLNALTNLFDMRFQSPITLSRELDKFNYLNWLQLTKKPPKQPDLQKHTIDNDSIILVTACIVLNQLLRCGMSLDKDVDTVEVLQLKEKLKSTLKMVPNLGDITSDGRYQLLQFTINLPFLIFLKGVQEVSQTMHQYQSIEAQYLSLKQIISSTIIQAQNQIIHLNKFSLNKQNNLELIMIWVHQDYNILQLNKKLELSPSEISRKYKKDSKSTSLTLGVLRTCDLKLFSLDRKSQNPKMEEIQCQLKFEFGQWYMETTLSEKDRMSDRKYLSCFTIYLQQKFMNEKSKNNDASDNYPAHPILDRVQVEEDRIYSIGKNSIQFRVYYTPPQQKKVAKVDKPRPG